MPIIAVSRQLKRLYPEGSLALHYIGPKDDFNLLLEENFKLHSIAAGKIRRYFSLQNITDALFKIPFSFLQSFFLLLFIGPQLVFSKGGTGSLPVTYCARLFKIPVFIHESDAVAGLSNKLASKWAKKIFISFEKTDYFNSANTMLAGNPIRKELLGANPEESKEALNLTSRKPVILFLGGSQGSRPLNEFILPILSSLLKKYEIIQVVGSKNYKEAQMQSKIFLSDKNLLSHYHIYKFLNEVELKNAYAAADIVISRAGAGNIFEIAAMGKPSILIPLPSSAKDHQAKNAYQYAKSGAAIVIEQESLSPNFFMGEIDNVISQSEKMKEAALKFAKPEAAETIAKEILNYLK